MITNYYIMIGKEVQYRGRLLKSSHLKDLFCKQIMVEKNKKTAPEIVRFQGAVVRDGRLELPTSCSQSKRATNCANPGFLVIEFCARDGQTCGQAVFLTISACGGSACIAGISRDCGHGIFRLEGGATRSQSRRATNCATPGY